MCSDSDIPPMKLPVTADQLLPHLCLQWEPIWNSHRIRSTFQMKCSTRSTCQMKCSDIAPHLKLSVTGDEVVADLCLQWEPIWNSHGIRSSFQMKCPSRSTFQMKCTMRSDIPPNWAWISGRPSHCLIFMTDWPHPLLQSTTDTWQTATLMDPPVNWTCIPGRPLHCIIFMTDWPHPFSNIVFLMYTFIFTHYTDSHAKSSLFDT